MIFEYLLVALMSSYITTAIILELFFSDEVSNWFSLFFLAIGFAIFGAINSGTSIILSEYFMHIIILSLCFAWVSGLMVVKSEVNKCIYRNMDDLEKDKGANP